MRKLNRPTKPIELSKNAQDILTQRHKDSDSDVWNVEYIRSPLIISTGGKCAYCESTGHNIEIDHFVNKSHNSDLVVEWTNLLPSCHDCNHIKHAHNVIIHPIINPYDQDPRDHIVVMMFRFYGLSNEGRMTIEKLNLQRLSKKRADLIMPIFIFIEQLQGELKILSSQKRPRRDRIQIAKNTAAQILEYAQPNAEYGSTAASAICILPEWMYCVQKLKDIHAWDTNLQDLQNNAENIALNWAGNPVPVTL